MALRGFSVIAMQISRIATIVAAGVITPALFLTTPAVAEEQPATTGQTAGQTTGQTTTQQGGGAVGPADTNPAPKTDTTDKDKAKPFRIPVTVKGIPDSVQAGTGDWTTFHVSFDNEHGDKDVTFTPQARYRPVKPDMGKINDYTLVLEYQTGPDARWQQATLATGINKDEGSFTVTASLGEHLLKKGDKATFDVRLRFEKQTLAHKARFQVMDAHEFTTATSEQEFSVKAVKPKPEPSKSPTASVSPTATESGKKNPDSKPSTSASASASASPSASSSSSTDAAGTTSGGSGGTTANGGRTELAATGSDPATPWIAAGGAAAIIAGAGMVVATRRRANARG
ncbi:LAETG motif-containing sortase-dependent surface protein [Streptomyces sp. NPDC000405]|uniref:LAETG motif-containing sortase-dependent surface protein n=1 Tax=Streptomyces sp. NPDC000405 TaxID=3161033 RepID=UPI00398CA7E8